MALIDPKGLLYGERLGDCSDEAQLHWPRLFATSNGYGRTELSYDRLCETVYSSFKKKPTHAQLSAWFQDYQTNFLLFIYEAPDGSLWGQWITSEKYLPKYKTSVDRQSPAPDPVAVKDYKDQYIRARKSKYLSFQSFHKSSETSGNVQKISEDFRRDVVVGVGVSTNTPPSRTRDAEQPEPPSPEAEPAWDENAPPPGLAMLQYAQWLGEKCFIPEVPATTMAIAAGIGAFGRERSLPNHQAAAELCKLARDALARGEVVDKWWFTDAKWRKKQEAAGGSNSTNRAQERVEQSRGAFRKAAERRGIRGVDGFAGPDGGELSPPGPAG